MAAPLIAAAAGWLSAHPARAQEPGSPAGRGLGIVAIYCGPCHAYDSAGASPRSEAPPFRVIVSRWERARLIDFLSYGMTQSHPAMPRYNFSDDDVACMVAYLDMLRPK
ncbi:MAG: cytochrome c [Variibacter sp.]|nr:cytochrome c [Variibacter sp.]